jgi:hypothetical protein
MFVARWQFTAEFGKVDDVVSLLRKWEIDVGERVGWRTSHVRLTTGVVGASNSQVELEIKVDSLGDLEAAWADMEKNPHHHEYLKQLAHVIVSGTNRWEVLVERDLIPGET